MYDFEATNYKDTKLREKLPDAKSQLQRCKAELDVNLLEIALDYITKNTWHSWKC